ncbi:MAG: hypothetical protein V4513_02825 [Pseudomonadota bacterium]
MTRIMILALAATASLAGCNKGQTIVAGGPDDRADAGSNVSAAPVVLPASIAASKSYRCGDNELVYIDWMSDGSARVKKTRDELGVTIAAGSAELKGDAKASAITYRGESCTA